MTPRLWCCLLLSTTLLAFVAVSHGQEADVTATSLCRKMTNCSACIAGGPLCAWCKEQITDVKEEQSRHRCDVLANHLKGGCAQVDIVNPDHDINPTKDTPPRSGSMTEKPIQLSPQEMKIKVRPNKPVNFKVHFKLAENYPVDLYYLMDMSRSMNIHREKLAALGVKISNEMAAITEDFRLGFGSYVDKVTMPYVSIYAPKLNNPCSESDKCAAPYGYRHELSLTNDAKIFSEKVLATPISGNLDVPEGGFDAVVQAVVCEETVGWRSPSRRLLIMSTDSPFHSAGDGKLAGIVRPNDLNCHMDADNYYTESLNQDYPSISQVREVLQNKDVVLIFAVTQNQFNVYKELSDFFPNSLTGELKNDSSNVVQLIKEVYQNISSQVELKTNSTEGISFKFRSECLGTKKMNTNKCLGLKTGQSVTFDVEMTVTQCPKDPTQKSRVVEISPGGGLGEKLVLNLEFMCECDCELPANEVPLSPLCEGQGTYQCGICQCDAGFAGRRCECETDKESTEALDAQCRRPNSTDLTICSNKGQCICGACTCLPDYRGPLCECNDFSCDNFEDQLCGGPTRGTCVCGKCVCNEGYSGNACSCPESKENCIASSGEECNGYGQCVCGVCQCRLESGHSGPTCEDCPTCPGLCEETKLCVQCTAFNSGEYSPEYCKANCTNIEMVPDVQKYSDEKIKFCQFKDDDDCEFYYNYEYVGNKKNIYIKVQQTKACPAQANVLAIVLGVIAGIVAIGLAILLIWKILTTINDRREFAKFEKEREQAKWDTAENPIFKQATSTFKNPTYEGQKS
ncbi:integrin beta-PS isoform X1 [Lingula anatina]|uniref:Integrin beta n=1 Tax=Lingula anatina TaxID=7574 RepID=A0A1S3I615_LINAN|nr:integrin beta-PS isoform X1 [Lingula anatina]XP_013393650.1 integrin beta-PS isoform X1 [Lingula anatina]|eukprot:XP_013393648.1 integrin beta-PS isoform X1 [Lingula anatina]